MSKVFFKVKENGSIDSYEDKNTSEETENKSNDRIEKVKDGIKNPFLMKVLIGLFATLVVFCLLAMVLINKMPEKESESLSLSDKYSDYNNALIIPSDEPSSSSDSSNFETGNSNNDVDLNVNNNVNDSVNHNMDNNINGFFSIMNGGSLGFGNIFTLGSEDSDEALRSDVYVNEDIYVNEDKYLLVDEITALNNYFYVSYNKFKDIYELNDYDLVEDTISYVTGLQFDIEKFRPVFDKYESIEIYNMYVRRYNELVKLINNLGNDLGDMKNDLNLAIDNDNKIKDEIVKIYKEYVGN